MNYRNVRNQRGSSLPMVIIIAGLVAIFSYIIFGMLASRRTGTEDELRTLQAKMLAADIIELGKYLLYYERVIYLQDPLDINTARTSTRMEFANQSYGSLAPSNAYMINACGGYDANAVQVGNLLANNVPVFCPIYLRNPLMDGNMFEDMLLNMWAAPAGAVGVLSYNGGIFTTVPGTRNPIMKKDPSGAYVVEIDLAKAIQATDNQFIRLHLNQNIIESMRQNGFSAKLKYSLFGISTGFKTQTNERFMTVESEVTFGPALARRSVNTAESMIVYSSTVKDFSLFIVYPEDVSGNATNLFSKSVNLGGPNSRVNGRVFFNGDIDTPLAQLPVFNEMVVISGQVNMGGMTVDQARPLLAEKFKKGIVVGFPVTRLINDGECVTGMPTTNASGMYCKNPRNLAAAFRVGDYIDFMGSVCRDLTVKYSGGSYTYDLTNNKDPARKEQCKGSAPGKLFLQDGAKNVTISGSYAYIVSPVKKLDAGGTVNIYGTILGGYIKAGNGSKFYSLAALRKGLPGILDESYLSAISSEGDRIFAGVGVPLINVPLIKDAAIGK